MRTEWGGDHVTPNNVQPKPSSALSASEKLRLTYLTGQPENALAALDGGRSWTGQVGARKTQVKRSSDWPFNVPASYEIESLLIPGPPGPQGPQGPVGPVAQQNLAIGQTRPTFSGPGMWVELDVNGEIETIWIETE